MSCSLFKFTVIVGKQGLKYSVKSHRVLFFSSTTILISLCCLFKVVACVLLRRFGTEGDFQYPSHFPLINEVIVSFFYGRNVIHSKQIEIMTWVEINFCYNFQWVLACAAGPTTVSWECNTCVVQSVCQNPLTKHSFWEVSDLIYGWFWATWNLKK